MVADQHAALFVEHGSAWLPTPLSRGPWSPDALHGGPVAALVAREMERIDAPVPMRLARLTLELLRPVTLEPLVVESRIVRPGAKVGLVEVDVSRVSDGVLVATARGLRIRVADVPFPDPNDDVAPDLPEAADPMTGSPGDDPTAYHSHAVEHRFAVGTFGPPGAAFDWMRLRVPVVPDEEPSPWQRAAAAADFGNGISSVVPFDGRSLFINPDLTVHLWREPVGEWIGLDAVTRSSPTGVGLAESAMWDRSGRIGRGLQSLLLDRN